MSPAPVRPRGRRAAPPEGRLPGPAAVACHGAWQISSHSERIKYRALRQKISRDGEETYGNVTSACGDTFPDVSVAVPVRHVRKRVATKDGKTILSLPPKPPVDRPGTKNVCLSRSRARTVKSGGSLFPSAPVELVSLVPQACTGSTL